MKKKANFRIGTNADLMVRNVSLLKLVKIGFQDSE